jgi:hypothetical protein
MAARQVNKESTHGEQQTIQYGKKFIIAELLWIKKHNERQFE